MTKITEEMKKGDRAIKLVEADKLETIIENQLMIMEMLIISRPLRNDWLIDQVQERVEDLQRRNQIMTMREQSKVRG